MNRLPLLTVAALLAGCTPLGPPGGVAVTAPVADPAPAPAPALVDPPPPPSPISEAHRVLAGQKGLTHLMRGSYEMFVDEPGHTVWVFTLPGADAYPAMVRRQLTGDGAVAQLRSTVVCEADEAACTLLRENTRAMDAAIAQRMSRPPTGRIRVPGGVRT